MKTLAKCLVAIDFYIIAGKYWDILIQQ